MSVFSLADMSSQTKSKIPPLFLLRSILKGFFQEQINLQGNYHLVLFLKSWPHRHYLQLVKLAYQTFSYGINVKMGKNKPI